MQALTYVEIDLDRCSLTYSVAPCTAVLGVTGDDRCFNSLKTCQDRPNFTNVPTTIRFAMAADYLPTDIEAVPSVTGVSFSPGVISLGENLGQRATLSVTFKDHKHSDTGFGGFAFDQYVLQRTYDPFEQGTFWGKFRARQPFLRGRNIRVIRGFVGQTLAQMDTRHYVMEAFDGPTPDGAFTITAKDVLKLADNERAQAPLLNTGSLFAAITAVAVTATLKPAGIGDLEYPASGKVAIGGKEICTFSRSADTLTLTRAQNNTIAIAHAVDDRVQLCLVYTGVDPAEIIADLLLNYASVDAAFVPVAEWLNETENFLQRLYSTVIAEPTGVNKLISEIIQQAALAMWWDDAEQKIRLQVLRSVSTSAARYTQDNVLEDSLNSQEQPATRLSQVWTFFGQVNPCEPVDRPDNYRSVELTVDLQAETDYGSSAIKTIYSRWIPALARSTATRLNELTLGRFRDPPRRFNFELFHDEPIALGGGYKLAAWPLQDETGVAVDAPIQITRLHPMVDKTAVEAEEMLFTVIGDGVDLNDRVIIVDTNTNNINLRTLHDTIYPEITDATGLTLRCIIQAGVIVGSADTTQRAFDVGTWVAGLPITLVVEGRIQGAGGVGGQGRIGTPAVPAAPGLGGGTALYTTYPIDLELPPSGGIWGGGGGGGGGGINSGFVCGGGGGGGAGTVPGAGGNGPGDRTGAQDGQPGTAEAGGIGGTGGIVGGGAPGIGGNGGGPGLAGAPGTQPGFAAGGSPGAAIDGISVVTVTVGPGDRRGLEVN